MTEKEIKAKIAYHKDQSRVLACKLHQLRIDRAKAIRAMYFKHHKSQTEIAKIFGIMQGSVSKIVSGFSCAG